ncbi:MAG: PKD domain-containing protein, partial [Candidatus Cloacimonetes bacterium]|nr:PKD domain-containing protein [Candidatus Cloacimonadota bacterium]
KLDYTSNSGSSWVPITSTAISAALGTYAWTVPSTLGSNYKIRIRRDPATTPNAIDLSDNKFTVANTIPEVAFIGDPLEGYQPLEVQFTDQTPMLSAPITSWQWNFGDGGSSTEQHPLHVYQTPGVYSVSLTVDNDLDEPRSLSKPDYIVVSGNVAQISLLSAEPLYFYAESGETTGWAEVQIQNTGTADLLISAVQSSHPSFTIMYEHLNAPLLPGATDIIYVRYTAANTDPVQAVLSISSNASANPTLPVALVANDVPVPVQNLVVNIVDDSAVLTWNPVTMSVLGNPITPDIYIVEYNEVAEDAMQAYYYLSATADTTFTHYLVARYEDMMFYRVLAVKDLSPALIRYLQGIPAKQEKISWENLKQRFAAGIPDSSGEAK